MKLETSSSTDRSGGLDGLPEALRRAGRYADEEFGRDEQLYIRVPSEKVIDGQVISNAVRIPDQSANRSRYCERPEWVLLPTYQDWKIAFLCVSGLDYVQCERGQGALKLTTRAFHEPEEDNYSHTEIGVLRGGERIPKVKSREHRGRLKDRLAEQLTVLEA